MTLINFNVYAQLNDLNSKESLAIKGVIGLKTGEKLKGDIDFNFITEIVKLRQGTIIRSFNPKNVIWFTMKFSDDRLIRYHTVEIPRPGSRIPESHFYEVLYEGSYFALIARLKFDVIETMQNSPTLSSNPAGSVTISESVGTVENIYFVDHKMNLVPYLTSKSKDSYYLPNTFVKNDGFGKEFEYLNELFNTSSDHKIKYKIVDKLAIEKVTGRRYEDLKNFAISNKLDLRTIDDNIKLLKSLDKIFNQQGVD